MGTFLGMGIWEFKPDGTVAPFPVRNPCKGLVLLLYVDFSSDAPVTGGDECGEGSGRSRLRPPRLKVGEKVI